MARLKNALRGYFVADYDGEETAPAEMMKLDRYVEDISPDIDEQVNTTGFYHGDGTPEQDVESKAVGYSFTGFLDMDDEAQAFVATKEFSIGDDMKVWFKRVSADGTNERVGVATLSNVVIGGGPATEYERFECNIRWDRQPEENTIPAG